MVLKSNSNGIIHENDGSDNEARSPISPSGNASGKQEKYLVK